jgi:peptide/nickel transport system substrate-binding protein
VDTFLAGLVPTAHSIIGPDEPEYPHIESSLVRYAHDPRRSLDLLDGMGLAKGADGFYVDPTTGRRMTIEIRTRSHVLREKVQQVLVDEWARVGIVGQPLVISEQGVNDRVLQATFPGFYFRFGAANQITNWRSNASPLPENNFVGNNTMRYQNAEYDSLVDRYLNTIPHAERMGLLGQMVAHTTDQVVPLPLYHEPEPVFINNRVVNVIGGRGVNIQGWNAHEWDLR